MKFGNVLPSVLHGWAGHGGQRQHLLIAARPWRAKHCSTQSGSKMAAILGQCGRIRILYHTVGRQLTRSSGRCARIVATDLPKSVSHKHVLVLSSLMYVAYEAYQWITHFSVVHANNAVPKLNETEEQADYLYGTGETEKLYELLIQHEKSENAELLWRLARATRDLSQLSSTSEAERKRLIYEAVDYAKKALDQDPSCFAAHKWYAICLNDIGEYEGIKSKIANAFVIQKHFKTAIELNPTDATSIHLLGLWSFFIAEMPWYQQKIASVLFATPPTSSFQEALQLFEKAEEVSPNFYSKNLLYLGKTYLKLKNEEKAIEWLLKTQQYDARTEEDKQVRKEATELLHSLGVK